MNTFVIGDIHGAHKLLLQCLKLSNFDKSQDRLICLGDVCDRGKDVKECIDELLTIPHCIYILGNHDAWALEWGINGHAPEEWLDQGGSETIKSYKDKMPQDHIRFLTDAHLYFVDENRLFIHGGFDPQVPVEKSSKDIFLWDRSLLKKAEEFNLIDPNFKFGNYDEVYIGHTPTLKFKEDKPMKFCNVWAMDTGAGWGSKLTIMDIGSKEFWQAI